MSEENSESFEGSGDLLQKSPRLPLMGAGGVVLKNSDGAHQGDSGRRFG